MSIFDTVMQNLILITVNRLLGLCEIAIVNSFNVWLRNVLLISHSPLVPNSHNQVEQKSSNAQTTTNRVRNDKAVLRAQVTQTRANFKHPNTKHNGQNKNQKVKSSKKPSHKVWRLGTYKLCGTNYLEAKQECVYPGMTDTWPLRKAQKIAKESIEYVA